MPETKPELSTLDWAYVAGPDAEGTVYPDSGTEGADGTILGGSPYSAPTWEVDTDTINRKYLAFPGAEGNATAGTGINAPRVDLPITEEFDDPDHLTIAFWLRVPDLSSTIAIASSCNGTGGSGDGVHVDIDSSERVSSYADAEQTFQNNSERPPPDTWTHVAIQLEHDEDGLIYINGSEVSGYFAQDPQPRREFGNALGKFVLGINEYTSTYRIVRNHAHDLADFIMAKRLLSADELSWLANPANTYYELGGGVTPMIVRRHMMMRQAAHTGVAL